jgi:hypothetical protein
VNAPASTQQVLLRSLSLPPIGTLWPEVGGIFVGIARGQNGAVDHVLILSEVDPGKLKWKAALEWAKSLKVNALEDFDLPTRSEQALLFANVPELFERDWWYWSNTPHASDSSYAWCQSFDDGYQVFNHEPNAFRARAVRRLPLQ